jgi:hypothetical protein
MTSLICSPFFMCLDVEDLKKPHYRSHASDLMSWPLLSNENGGQETIQGLWERGSAGTSVRGPESKEGAFEFLKGPHSLSHRSFILIFSYFLYFQLKSSILSVVSTCPRGPKGVLFCLAKYFLVALRLLMHHNLKVSLIFIVCLQFPLKVRISIWRLKLLSVILRYKSEEKVLFLVFV